MMKAITYYENTGEKWIPVFECWGGRIRFLSRFSNFGQVSVTEVQIPDQGVREFCRAAVQGGARPESRVPDRDRCIVQG